MQADKKINKYHTVSPPKYARWRYCTNFASLCRLLHQLLCHNLGSFLLTYFQWSKVFKCNARNAFAYSGVCTRSRKRRHPIIPHYAAPPPPRPPFKASIHSYLRPNIDLALLLFVFPGNDQQAGHSGKWRRHKNTIQHVCSNSSAGCPGVQLLAPMESINVFLITGFAMLTCYWINFQQYSGKNVKNLLSNDTILSNWNWILVQILMVILQTLLYHKKNTFA